MKFKLTFPNILLLTAVLSVAAGAVVFAAGYPARGDRLADIGWAALALVLTAGVMAFMHRFRFTTWLTLTLIGYIVGLVSALQLLMIPNVVGGYGVAVLTVVTFAGHGLVIGMFAEFIMKMHKVTHGLLDRMIKGDFRPRDKSKEDEKVRLPENRE